MKNIIRALTIVTVFFYGTFSEAINGNEVARRFRNRMSGITSMTGTISWIHQFGDTYTGEFQYMAPNKIYVKFSTPSGRIMVSNGEKLWIYDGASGLCGVQELGKGGSGGISAYLKNYEAILEKEGRSGYTISLINDYKHFSDIILKMDSTYLMQKIVLKTKKGGGFTLYLSNVRTKVSIPEHIFDFHPPGNAQMIENPLNIK